MSSRTFASATAASPRVDGVSFEIEPGEIFGLLGPNGAGKTTTVECLIGLAQPDAGSIEICGLDARREPRAVKERIGAALQSTALQDKITPREALTLFGAFYAKRQAPEALLERFNLTAKADATFDTLSGGQRQRLALALAFVNEPELVFLDEPTSGLDPQARRELHDDILQMKRDGHTVLLTTHYLDEAEALCDRVAIIARGRVVAAGAPHDLMAGSSARQAATIVTTIPIGRTFFEPLRGIERLEAMEMAGDSDAAGGASTRWRLEGASVTPALASLLPALSSAGIEIVELHVQRASLEDVFLELTRPA